MMVLKGHKAKLITMTKEGNESEVSKGIRTLLFPDEITQQKLRRMR